MEGPFHLWIVAVTLERQKFNNTNIGKYLTNNEKEWNNRTLTRHGWSFWAPWISTSLNLRISTPRLLALWCVEGETSLMVISFLKHLGDWSRSRLAFLSSSQITTVISAGTNKGNSLIPIWDISRIHCLFLIAFWETGRIGIWFRVTRQKRNVRNSADVIDLSVGIIIY